MALFDVVRQVVNFHQAGLRLLHARGGIVIEMEIDIVNAAIAVAVDKVQQAFANAVNRRNTEFHRADFGFVLFCAVA